MFLVEISAKSEEEQEQEKIKGTGVAYVLCNPLFETGLYYRMVYTKLPRDIHF